MAVPAPRDNLAAAAFLPARLNPFGRGFVFGEAKGTKKPEGLSYQYF
jgi:hypothetical protein